MTAQTAATRQDVCSLMSTSIHSSAYVLCLCLCPHPQVQQVSSEEKLASKQTSHALPSRSLNKAGAHPSRKQGKMFWFNLCDCDAQSQGKGEAVFSSLPLVADVSPKKKETRNVLLLQCTNRQLIRTLGWCGRWQKAFFLRFCILTNGLQILTLLCVMEVLKNPNWGVLLLRIYQNCLATQSCPPLGADVLSLALIVHTLSLYLSLVSGPRHQV